MTKPKKRINDYYDKMPTPCSNEVIIPPKKRKKPEHSDLEWCITPYGKAFVMMKIGGV